MKTIQNVILIASILLLSCNPIRITSSWKTGNVQFTNFQKILVIGLIKETDRSLQENMENHLADDLKDLGYIAITSLSEYGPKAFENMSEKEVLAKLKNSGIDAVLTIVLLDKKKENKYVPGYMYGTPYSYYYRNFWGYRTILYNRIYEPGYYITESKYFWESNFYDMRSDNLLYSVQTQSFNIDNSQNLGHEYGKAIIKNMVKQNIITAK